MDLQQIKEKSDQIIHNSIPHNGVPGAHFLALARDGSTIYSTVVGTRSKSSDQPITEDTVFWIASATKVLTAICAVKCVDQGLITLDEDVIPHLPDLAQQQVWEKFGVPESKLVPRQGHVTLRQLLSMTSGVSYPVLQNLGAKVHAIPTGTEPFMAAEKSEYVGPFECQPGTKWAYSGAIDWAGALVEALSGMSLGDYLKKYILEPCGVKEITFNLTPDMHSRLAGAHFRMPDGTVLARGKIFSDDVQAHLGGAGAYATASNYAQVLLLLINEGKHPITRNQVLKPALVKEMYRGQLNEQQLAWLNRPTPANKMLPLLPGVEKQWGLGFLTTPTGTPSGRGSDTATWAGFANTHWMADNTKGVVMVVFAQLIPQEDEELLATRDKWERVIYDAIGQGQSRAETTAPELSVPNSQVPLAVSHGG